MKQFITFLALIFSYMLCGAQATSLTVDNQTPGWLSSKIEYGDQQSVENLTISGYLNPDDLKFIGSLISNQSLSGRLDISDVQIIDKSGQLTNTFADENSFQLTSPIKNGLSHLLLPTTLKSAASRCLSSLRIDTLTVGGPALSILSRDNFGLTNNAYGNNTRSVKHLIIREGVEEIGNGFYDINYAAITEPNLETIQFPKSLKTIGDKAFVQCSNLSYISFHEELEAIGNYAFAETAYKPDTLALPSYLKVYHTRSFPQNAGQVIIIPNCIEKIDNDDGNDYYLNLHSGIERDTKYTIIINNAKPPRFVAGYTPHVDLSSCDLYVPKDGISNYKNPNYGVYGGDNPYSYANVKPIAIPIESVTLNYQSYDLNVGNTVDLCVTIQPTNADNRSVIWQSSDSNIAQVSQNGKVTALSSGSCLIKVISAENENVFATCEITVRQPLQTITLNTKKITLTAGQTFDGLSLTYYPISADNKNVTWQSSDVNVATVDYDGKITAIQGGEARITVISEENSNIKDECTVTVLQPTTGISLDKSEIEIIEDESIQLIATVLPENATNKSVNWTSSDISVAMVSPDGTVYALKAGQATIMATTVDGGLVALCKVTVKAKTIQISNIELSSNSESIAVGETLQLNAIISPDNASNKTVNWTSTNPSIASVNASGLATAIAEGKTQIIATTTDGSNLSAICEITVNKQFISVSQIQIMPSNARITVGQTLNLSAAIAPDDATNKAIKWSSTNPAIATVSESGVVSAISEGNVIIIASTQDGSNLSATCQVEVYTETILVETINLNPIKIEGAVNDTYEIEAIVLPTNATNKNLTWKSSDESIVTVDDGAITLHALGTAIITAEAMDGSNVKSECSIIVSHEAGLDSIIADKESDVKVFNLSGYLIYEGIYSEAKLAPGFYIVLCNGASYKTKVD